MPTARAYPLIGAAIILLLWWAGSAIIANSLLLPSPLETLRAMLDLIKSPTFFSDISSTTIRVAYAFLLSSLLGLAAGTMSGLFLKFSAIASPAMAALRTVPFISLSVLALVWFRSGAVPIFVAFLMAFPIVASVVKEGISSVDNALVEMSRVYRVPAARMARQLYAPSLAPYLISAAAQSMGISWKIVVSAEVLSLPRLGIGARMDTARAFLDTADLFAWTLLLVLIGYMADMMLGNLMRASLKRRQGAVWKA